MRVARVLIGVSLFAAVIVVTVREWRAVSETAAEIGPSPILASLSLTLLGLGASALTWRVALREFGAAVSVPAASKIYLVGQLGKYIPGSVWALVVQMELARQALVRRTQALGAGVVSIWINMVTGSALGLMAQFFLGGGSTHRYIVAGLGIICCSLVLAPPVLGWFVNRAMALMRQEPLRRPTARGILGAAGFSVSSWLLYGLALSVLAIAAGAEARETLILALPAVALAMTIGFLVVVSPSGLGVREAVLVAAVSPVLDARTALGVALVLRVVFTLADLIAAAVTVPIRIARASQTQHAPEAA
jgi:hypothetical protein